MNEKHHQIPMLTNCEVSFGLPFLRIPTAGYFSLCLCAFESQKISRPRQGAMGLSNFFAPLGKKRS